MNRSVVVNCILVVITILSTNAHAYSEFDGLLGTYEVRDQVHCEISGFENFCRNIYELTLGYDVVKNQNYVMEKSSVAAANGSYTRVVEMKDYFGETASVGCQSKCEDWVQWKVIFNKQPNLDATAYAVSFSRDPNDPKKIHFLDREMTDDWTSIRLLLVKK